MLVGQRHGAGDDVMDIAHGDGEVEEVAEQFDDATVGTVADEDQGQDQLPQPGLGDGQIKEDAVVGWLSESKAERRAWSALSACW